MAREDEIQRLLSKTVMDYVKKRTRARNDPWHVSSELTRYSDPRLLHMQSAALTLARQRNKQFKADLEAEQARKEALEKAWHEEKTNWINCFGSSRLKKARAAGYACEVPYAQERVNREWGDGWVVDSAKECQCKPITYPSEEALDIEQRMISDGYKVEIMWLVSNGTNGTDEHFRKCEGVVVYGYLGKYKLVREMR